MKDIKLILPDGRYKDSYVTAMREGLYSSPATPEEILLAEGNFDAYMSQRRDMNYVFVLPGGIKAPRVPSTEFWMVRDDAFLGRIAVRHKLSEHLEKVGGHIGYAIRASMRGKGYGTLILNLAIPRAKELGLKKVLLTCNDDNHGSIKIIESAGGILQDKIPVEGRPVLHRRYWIYL